MPNPSNALATLAALLLAACGSQQQAAADNAAVATEGVAAGNGSRTGPERAGTPADRVVEPAVQQPPDAVSHPQGYLPPAPDTAEPTAANGSEADGPLPATEDEYMRNRQSGGGSSR